MHINVVFLEHLKQTHQQTHDTTTECPNHTCIIKAKMSYKNKQSTAFNKNLYNRLLDKCGDSDITNGSKSFVDPALKFFYNIPLMMNTNERIDEKLANGTPCRGLYIILKKGEQFTKKNWEGYMVNTVCASKVKCIICKYKDTKEKYFTVKPETRQCKIRLRMYNNITLDSIKITYLPVNCNISTTGHKLQGKTLSHLVVNSWAYKCTHWVYVVLSRVKNLNSLVLNTKLDTERSYKAKKELLTWEQITKNTIENQTFKERGKSDYDKFLKEEKQYLI